MNYKYETTTTVATIAKSAMNELQSRIATTLIPAKNKAQLKAFVDDEETDVEDFEVDLPCGTQVLFFKSSSDKETLTIEGYEISSIIGEGFDGEDYEYYLLDDGGEYHGLWELTMDSTLDLINAIK